jgi:hypothetical protein
MINLFCGYDVREDEGYEVFAKSVLRRSSRMVAVTRLDARGLPVGSNAFTLSRFLCAELAGYRGMAVYMDACDMLCLADIAELEHVFDPGFALQVVRHSYKTRNPMKYVGTEMECPNRDYPRKNWASVMLINCEHVAWRRVSRAKLIDAPIVETLQLRMFAEDEIGVLPNEWNRLVDEGQAVEGAKVLHWTAGSPFMPSYANAPGADLWRAEAAR